MHHLKQLLAVTFVSRGLAQFIPPPQDLTTVTGHAGMQVRYKQVPHGICELNNSVKSYSGYVDVAPDQHMFFWFFESRNNPLSDPLTMWISGGPGSTSMSELFQDFGPCKINRHIEPVNNPYSWTQTSSFIFIDQPIEIGFSYTTPIPGWEDPDRPDVTSIIGLPNNTCPDYVAGLCGTFGLPSTILTANSTDAAAENIWRTLQGFMGAFPQYSNNGFHLATESYGGHYGPVFAQYIEEQNNKNITDAVQIDLQTLIVGNGWYDPLLQNIAYYNYSVDPGNTYDLQVFNPKQAAKMYNSLFGPGNCVDQTLQCYETGRDDVCSQADSFCGNYVEGLFVTVSGRDETDIRELSPDPLPEEYFYTYLNRIHVLEAIGAFTNLSDYPVPTVHAFGNTGDDSRTVSAVPDIQSLLARGITVMLYAGDADFECNWMGGEAVALQINSPGFSKAGYVNVTTPDDIVHAQVRQSEAFSFVRVYQAGHEVPYYQPEVTQQMFARAIKGLDVATGLKRVKLGDGYKTVGPLQSLYREGNATVQYHKLPRGSSYNITSNEPIIPKKKGRRTSKRRRSGAK